MGLLNEIINNKMQRHTQQQAIAQQNELQYLHDAYMNAPNADAQQYWQGKYFGSFT